MNCLIDYILLEGCNNADAASGYYLNRLLPGIPLESIDKIAEADQVTYLEVYSDVQKRAALRFEQDVIREFQSRYQIRGISESFDLLKFIDTVNNQTALAGKWRGFTIELIQENQYRWVQSALQCINIQSVRLYRKAVTADINGKIFNLETGEVLGTFTVPVNAAAGWTEVNISLRTFVPRVFVAFDSTAVNCVELSIDSDIVNKFHGCACEFFFSDCQAAIRGAESSSLLAEVTDDNITTGDNLFGFSGVFSIGCSYHSIVCQNKAQFLMPWAFILGRELMWERLNSSRINRFTIGWDAEKGKKLQSEFDAAYRADLKTVVEGIGLNQYDCCLECNAPIQYRESQM